MNWHYQSGDQSKGPVTDAELEALAASGAITPTTLIWQAGMDGWKPLGEVLPGLVRPDSAVAPSADGVAPGEDTLTCDSCGRYVPRRDILQISSRNICSTCKPSVIQAIQQSGDLSVLEDAERDGPAWEKKDSLGVPKALWETVKAVLISPSATFARMKCEGGSSIPLYYFLLTSFIGAAATLGYQAIYKPSFSQAFLNQGTFAQRGAYQASPLASLIVMPIIFCIIASVGAAILHLCLKICGGANRPMETTFRVFCYTLGSIYFVQVLPIAAWAQILWFALFIWAIVLLSIGLSKTHEIGLGRAIFAVLLPVILCCGLWGTFMAIAFAAIRNIQH